MKELENQAFRQALLYLEKGHQQASTNILKALVAAEANFHPAYNLLGAIAFQSKDYPQALTYLKQAIQLQAQAEYYFSLGQILVELKQLPEALKAFMTSAELDSKYLAPRQKLVEYYRAEGHLQAVKKYLREMAEITPHENYLWELLIHYHQQSQDWQDTLQLCQIHYRLDQPEALATQMKILFERHPNPFPLIFPLGSNEILTSSSWRFFKELTHLAAPQDQIHAWINLGILAQHQGQESQADDYFKTAQTLEPHNDTILFQQAFTLPYIYKSQEDLLYWRARLLDKLQDLSQKAATNQIQPSPYPQPTANFVLAYNGLDNKPVLEQTASLMSKLYAKHLTPLPFKPAQKRRIGIVCAFLYEHSVFHCYKDLLMALQLDSEIELLCFTFQEQSSPNFPLTLLQPQSYETNLTILKEAHLDLLLFPEIGMHTETYALALNRLAPIQCVLTGHPVTTGLATIDYLITGQPFVTAQASAYYSEHLIVLSGLPGVHYSPPLRPTHLKTRQELGLPSQGRIYTCPMTLIKIHPDFDQTLAEILTLDSEAQIILFQTGHHHLHPLLMERFKQSMSSAQMERIHFLPWLAESDFYRVLLHSDVLLDPFHFGGGNTCFIALGLGVPMVTWPSPYLRGRVCSGLYQLMGLSECIAQEQKDYASLAFKIASNPKYKHHISQAIVQHNHHLFNDQQGVAELIKKLKTLQPLN